ncbi:mRNA-decapping protein g5R [Balamuthia mandrillaris]
METCTILGRVIAMKKPEQSTTTTTMCLTVCDDSGAIDVVVDTGNRKEKLEDQASVGDVVNVKGTVKWLPFHCLQVEAETVTLVERGPTTVNESKGLSINNNDEDTLLHHLSTVIRAFGVIAFIPTTSTKSAYSVMLVKLHRNEWGFPKGHLDDGETAQTCALREFEEETGVPREFLQLIHNHDKQKETTGIGFEDMYHSRYRFKFGTKMIEKQTAFCVARVLKERVEEVPVRIQAEEIAEFRWATYEEALECLTFEGSRACLRLAHRDIMNHLQKRG